MNIVYRFKEGSDKVVGRPVTREAPEKSIRDEVQPVEG